MPGQEPQPRIEGQAATYHVSYYCILSLCTSLLDGVAVCCTVRRGDAWLLHHHELAHATCCLEIVFMG